MGAIGADYISRKVLDRYMDRMDIRINKLYDRIQKLQKIIQEKTELIEDNHMKFVELEHNLDEEINLRLLNSRPPRHTDNA